MKSFFSFFSIIFKKIYFLFYVSCWFDFMSSFFLSWGYFLVSVVMKKIYNSFSLDYWFLVYKKITKPFVAMPHMSSQSSSQTLVKSCLKKSTLLSIIGALFYIVGNMLYEVIYFNIDLEILKFQTSVMKILLILATFIMIQVMSIFLVIVYLFSHTKEQVSEGESEGISNFMVVLFLVIIFLIFVLMFLMSLIIYFMFFY